MSLMFILPLKFEKKYQKVVKVSLKYRRIIDFGAPLCTGIDFEATLYFIIEVYFSHGLCQSVSLLLLTRQIDTPILDSWRRLCSRPLCPPVALPDSAAGAPHSPLSRRPGVSCHSAAAPALSRGLESQPVQEPVPSGSTRR